MIAAPPARRDLALGCREIDHRDRCDERSYCSEARQRFAMGFLKRILRNGVSDDPTRTISDGSFETLSDDELQAHMGIASYGVFDLTDAIRPSYDLQIVPKAGVPLR